jgi:hypothetical protein
VIVRDEHDDDLAPSVDTRNDVETDDFPKTSDDFEAEDEEQENTDRDDDDDESMVGK